VSGTVYLVSAHAKRVEILLTYMPMQQNNI
jgi:hypothetical protein